MQTTSDNPAFDLGKHLDQSHIDGRNPLAARLPWDWVVAAILMPLTHPQVVNRHLAWLQETYADPLAMAGADPRILSKKLRSLPLFHGKVRSLIEAARYIIRQHDGQVPGQREALMLVPGLGPTGAAVVADAAFAVPALPIDNEALRVVKRCGWAVKRSEAADYLARLFPPQAWATRCRQLSVIGREICRPIKPRCGACPLAPACAIAHRH